MVSGQKGTGDYEDDLFLLCVVAEEADQDGLRTASDQWSVGEVGTRPYGDFPDFSHYVENLFLWERIIQALLVSCILQLYTTR